MRTARHIVLSLVILGVLNAATLRAQGTAFTYQGRLADNGAPANGAYDFQFTIFDALSGGNSLAVLHQYCPVA